MPTIQEIKAEIVGQTVALVGSGLANDQTFPTITKRGSWREINVANPERVPISPRGESYEAFYQLMRDSRVYNVRMVDGALIQIMYEFFRRTLMRQRLAFLPAPGQYPFQGHESLYLDDVGSADTVIGNVVPCLVRWDYDAREGKYASMVHPKSHLTLGRYKHCRIPVTAPLGPRGFIDFVVRNFYDGSDNAYADMLPASTHPFPISIDSAERRIVHVAVP